MPRLAHRSVRSLLYGYKIETGVDSEHDLTDVGSTGDHWCYFRNMNESPRRIRVIARVRKTDGLRYHRSANDGSSQRHLRWAESATLPGIPEPGFRWLTRTEPDRVELHCALVVVDLAKSHVTLTVQFKGRRSGRGRWEDAGEAVLTLGLRSAAARRG